jgi:TRAP-type C4-dicarboxylate transport system permease small subunit
MFRGLLRWLKGGADSVAAGLFATLFVVFIVQITARFVFNKPLPWTDELAVVLYLWVILWSAAFVVPEREHVVFDLLWNVVGKRIRRVMKLVGYLMIGSLAAWALPGCWDYVHFMHREGTPVLQLSFMWVFLPFPALLVALVVRSVHGIWSTLKGRGLETDLPR